MTKQKKVISLDAARANVEEKYASVYVPVGDDEVELVNPLRMSEKNRTALKDLQNSFSDGADKRETLEEIFRLVARTKAQGNKLVKALDGDLALMVEVFEQYSDSAQAGEASASQD